MFKLWIGGAVALLAFGGAGDAAELGARYTSYRDLHQETQYGSLFLNEGSIRYRDSRQRKRFVLITGDGALKLPVQQGYCFVFNHYDSPTGNDVPHIYRAVIRKSFSDGRETEDSLERTFSPTSSVVSADLPDLCISGTNNVARIDLEFSSDDGSNFDWKISFALD